MTTGVDAQTCKLIVLDQRIQSMTEFKQIIGRGKRIKEDYGKFYLTIIDFKKATELFADPDFDGDPVQIYEPKHLGRCWIDVWYIDRRWGGAQASRETTAIEFVEIYRD